MTTPRTLYFLALSLPLSISTAISHAADTPPPTLPTADIAVERTHSAPNDLFRAQVYYETTDVSPGELARKVNNTIANALQVARGYTTVKLRTSGNSTYPIYAKTGRTIDSWRMRASLTAESRDAGQLSELIGRLQQTMVVGSLSSTTSPETSKKVEDEAIADAINAFEARAKLVAGSLDKKWRLKHISVNTSGVSRPPIMPMARSVMAVADAAPAPIEAGESPVSVSVTGQIELLE